METLRILEVTPRGVGTLRLEILERLPHEPHRRRFVIGFRLQKEFKTTLIHLRSAVLCLNVSRFPKVQYAFPYVVYYYDGFVTSKVNLGRS